MPSIVLRHAAAAILLSVAGVACAQDAAQQLPAILLGAGMHIIKAELAQTPDQRAIGLMHRKTMPSNDGMLFVFEQPAPQCFWMKNTLLPLSIAFIADDGTVASIEEMAPGSLDSHCSTQPVRYALEMNQGWFAKRGIKAGGKLTGKPFGNG
ncbi:MAG: DUF192 domain-containing protein [Burkholderiaceae bacterium]